MEEDGIKGQGEGHQKGEGKGIEGEGKGVSRKPHSQKEGTRSSGEEETSPPQECNKHCLTRVRRSVHQVQENSTKISTLTLY